MGRCPDFPGTPQAIAALGTMIEANGWETTPDNMEAAHAYLVRTRVYAPLTPVQTDSRQQMKPPPMIRSNSPDGNQPVFNEDTATSAQLRERYFQTLRALQGQ
jgi:hypothetical protein